MVTSVPGARMLAAWPPVSVEPLVVAVICALVETEDDKLMLLPAGPPTRDVTCTCMKADWTMASTFGSPEPALIKFTKA